MGRHAKIVGKAIDAVNLESDGLKIFSVESAVNHVTHGGLVGNRFPTDIDVPLISLRLDVHGRSQFADIGCGVGLGFGIGVNFDLIDKKSARGVIDSALHKINAMQAVGVKGSIGKSGKFI